MGPYGANSTLSGRSSAEPTGRASEAAACLAGGVLADVLAVNVAEVHERLVQHRVRAGYAYLMCTAHACMRLSCGAECACVHAHACVYAYARVCMCACVHACDRWVVCSAVQCIALHCIARRVHSAILTFDCWSFFTVDRREWQRQDYAYRRTVRRLSTATAVGPNPVARGMLCWSHP